ncbi:hypothetical protein BRADI_2g24896v3 [Brachypodium distachyon]|uniref:Uncharacterized protein n=1 Tax=Brachypodium distachyon TaxID=15368 RepID=A0A2K2DA94_BRADI|nr:hypothetical protein BRADI_2g24896v3 [Brachypodium distachyon]
METRNALAKSKDASYHPKAAPSAAAEGRHIGHKKAKAVRDAAPSTERFYTCIEKCMTDAAAQASKREELAAKSEEVAASRWATVIKKQEEAGGLGDLDVRHFRHGRRGERMVRREMRERQRHRLHHRRPTQQLQPPLHHRRARKLLNWDDLLRFGPACEIETKLLFELYFEVAVWGCVSRLGLK